MNVYLIWEEGTSRFKIGKANDVSDRRSIFQTGNSNHLKVIGTYPTPDAIRKEKYFQSKYRDYCVRGEWYSFPPQVIPEVLADFSICDKDVLDTPVYKLLTEKSYILQEANNNMTEAAQILQVTGDSFIICWEMQRLYTQFLLRNPINTQEDLEAFKRYEEEVRNAAFDSLDKDFFDTYIKPRLEKTSVQKHEVVV